MRTRTGRTAPWCHLGTFAAAVVGALLVVACGSSPAGDPEFAVESNPTGFVLSWNPDRVGARPDIEVATQAPRDKGWSRPTEWVPIPVPDDADGEAHYQATQVDQRYRFRIRAGDEWSEPVRRVFVQPSLPVLRLDTDDGADILDDPKTYRDGHLRLEGAAAVNAGADLSVDMRVRGRGNSTWDWVPEKKSYQVDFGHQVSLLGMPESDKWVLLANYLDPSQMRNWTAMQIARATDLAWTPRSAWVELYLNGDYHGIYEVYEKVDTGAGKIAIDEPAPGVTAGEALTGGYLLQIEYAEKPGKESWQTPQGVQISLQRPKASKSNPAQFDYIRDHVNRFEAALFSDEFTDPETGYRRYLDVDSFIDLWIVEELTADTDAYLDSVYFFKKRGDDKLYFGPVWDFDTSLGTRFLRGADLETPWHTTTARRALDVGEPSYAKRTWVRRLFEDPWFRDRVAQRWHAAEPDIAEIPDELLEVSEQLTDARANDLLRWKDTGDQVRSFHRYGDDQDLDEPEFIAEWLRERIGWISQNVDTVVPADHYD